MSTKTAAVATATETTEKGYVLPEFQNVIRVEVAVQGIYKMLLGQFPEDYKHKEIVAHAIVGSGESSGGLAFVYNALCGFPPSLDFQIGDEVECTEEDRHIWADHATEAGKQIRQSAPIGKSEVVDINFYDSRGNTLLVKFMDAKYGCPGEFVENKAWVSHKNCTKWAVKVVDENRAI